MRADAMRAVMGSSATSVLWAWLGKSRAASIAARAR